MKSRIESTGPDDYEIGDLMQCIDRPDLIVLISAIDFQTDIFAGQVIHRGNEYWIGHYSTGWSIGLFQPFQGKIILEQ